MNNKLRIGEFSKLCCVTIKALHLYEEKKILIPAEIDDNTGYRYYELSQTLRLSQIMHLKHLGLSLDEIAELFENGEYRPDTDTVKQKIKHCTEELQRLQNQLRELQCMENESINKKNMNRIEIKAIPSRIVASHRQVIKSYDELGPLCYNVIGPEMMRVGCTCPEPQYCYTVEHDNEHKEQNVDVEYCEAVGEMHPDTAILKFYKTPAIEVALCAYHRGAYSRFSETMAELLAYIQKNGYQIVDSPRFCYIDGAWNKDNENEYLTEIQIPIK